MKKEVNLKRFFGLDLVRTIAIIFVVMVHSFGNTSFNDRSMIGMSMFTCLSIKWLTFTCVALFIILTGYCKSNKKVDNNHYKKIVPIVITYIVVSIITIVFKKIVLNDISSFYSLILGIFNFSTIPYAWYVEMYIGLFLLIPFFNILYKNIPNKKQKQILLISLIFTCSIPQSLLIFNVSGHSLDCFPSWWSCLYPLMFYFIGCYIKEYQIKIKKIINIFFIAVILFIETFMIYFYCQGHSLNSVVSPDYNFIPNVLLSILIFLLFYNVDIKNNFFTKVIYLVSKYSFGMYLISFIFDNLFYKVIKINFNFMFKPIEGILIYTPIIIFASFFTSFIIENVILKITGLFCKKKN